MPYMPGAWMEYDPLADPREQPEIVSVRMKAHTRVNAVLEARGDMQKFNLSWAEVVEVKQHTIYDSLDEDLPEDTLE